MPDKIPFYEKFDFSANEAQMEEAVHLYTKRGYVLIDNYPPYDKLEGVICFAKEL